MSHSPIQSAADLQATAPLRDPYHAAGGRVGGRRAPALPPTFLTVAGCAASSKRAVRHPRLCIWSLPGLKLVVSLDRSTAGRGVQLK